MTPYKAQRAYDNVWCIIDTRDASIIHFLPDASERATKKWVRETNKLIAIKGSHF